MIAHQALIDRLKAARDRDLARMAGENSGAERALLGGAWGAAISMVEDWQQTEDEALVALAAARLWLVGEYAGLPRTEFNGEAWRSLVDRAGRAMSGLPGWMHTARTFRLRPGSTEELHEGVRRVKDMESRGW